MATPSLAELVNVGTFKKVLFVGDFWIALASIKWDAWLPNQ